MNDQFSRSNCSVAECFSDKSRWRWNKQVSREGAKRFEQSDGFD